MSVDSVGCPGRRQIVGAWVACGAANDAFVTVNGEGNHKGCPYKNTGCGAWSLVWSVSCEC